MSCWGGLKETFHGKATLDFVYNLPALHCSHGRRLYTLPSLEASLCDYASTLHLLHTLLIIVVWHWHLALVEKVPPKNKSALWFKCHQMCSATCKTTDQSLTWGQTHSFFQSSCFSFQSQMSKSAFHWCKKKQGEWSCGECSSDETLPQLSCQMLKMGSSGHRGSTQGVCARKVVEADD